MFMLLSYCSVVRYSSCVLTFMPAFAVNLRVEVVCGENRIRCMECRGSGESRRTFFYICDSEQKTVGSVATIVLKQ